MPARSVPLVNDNYYHIFNRGINKQPIFLNSRDYRRALESFEFYSFANQSMRFSKFLSLPKDQRENLWQKVKGEGKKLVEIICFIFMPNHFHFLIKQVSENGISKFLRLFQDSYTRYFTTKYQGIGPILQGQFKAVRIEDEDQLLHLSRYIHLNPYTSYLIKEINQLENYPWSSLPEYLEKKKTSLCSKKIISSNFKNFPEYEKFIFDQAAYQRELERIKHLVLEKV